jgi:hypothetical protein
MKIPLRACWLAGPLGLTVLLALPAGAQKTNSQGDQINHQNSQAYQRGYRQGLKDRRDNLEPNAGDANWNDGADLPAYNSGYRAGYCYDEGEQDRILQRHLPQLWAAGHPQRVLRLQRSECLLPEWQRQRRPP